MSSLNNTVIWVGTVVIIISLIISVLYPKKNIKYMERFFFVILIALALSINSIFGSLFFLYNIKLFVFIQSCLDLLDLIFWTFFFLKLLPDKKNKIIISIFFITSLLFSFIFFFHNNLDKSNLQILVVFNVCKSVFCILFYHTLFKNLTYQNILSEQAFWIVNGLIFYSSLSLPFYGLNFYIKEQFSPLISNNIFSISNMLIIIMHLFFIKAYLCRIQVHKG